MALKLIEHLDSYTKAKRNLLFVSSLIIIIYLASTTPKVSIPGFGESLAIPRGLIMLLLFLANFFFAWEYKDQYRSAESRYSGIRMDTSDVDVGNRLKEYVKALEEFDAKIGESLTYVAHSREFLLSLPEKWSSTTEEWRNSVESSLERRHEEVMEKLTKLEVDLPKVLGEVAARAINSRLSRDMHASHSTWSRTI